MNLHHVKSLTALVLASLLAAGTAHAVPLTWTLQNVTFDDGGSANGSFDFDADTTSYSNIMINTTDPNLKKQPGFVVAVTTAGKDGESLVMFTNRKYTLLCVAVLAVSAIFISCPSQAATLSSLFGSAYLGNSGTGHYDNTGTGGSLEGDVEYAVFDIVKRGIEDIPAQ
jgi:hypothetical protein